MKRAQERSTLKKSFSSLSISSLPTTMMSSLPTSISSRFRQFSSPDSPGGVYADIVSNGDTQDTISRSNSSGSDEPLDNLVIYSGSDSNDIESQVQALSELPSVEYSSKIDLKEARQALKVMSLSVSEESQRQDSKLSRQLFIYALGRLLATLPPLTESEVFTLLEHLPHPVRAQLLEEALAVYNQTNNNTNNKKTGAAAPQNFMEELVVSSIRIVFIGLKTAAPYLKEYIAVLRREERKYKVSERMITSSFQMAEIASRSHIGQLIISRTQGLAVAMVKGFSQGVAIMIDE